MPIVYDHVNKNALSGTELMMQGLEKRLDQKLLQSFSIGRAIALFKNSSNIKLYWTHNLPTQRIIAEIEEQQTLRSPNRWHIIDGVVFVSEWQKQEYINYYKLDENDIKRLKVLRNAITPFENREKPKDKIRLIYTSVPERGLSSLYNVFERVSKLYDEVELDVYSSYKIYGVPNVDIVHRQVLDKIKAHPKINYYGTVSNDEIREAMLNSHIFAYPSSFQETSCISLIEAMGAKCLCVHPDIGAMAETANGFTNIYPFDRNRWKQEELFEKELIRAIEQIKSGSVSHLEKQKEYIDQNYSWDLRIQEWNTYLNELLNEREMKNGENIMGQNVDRALIIRRLKVPESLEYAQMCADSCEKHGVPYEFIDGVEFMTSEDAVKSVGAWLHPDNVKKKVSAGNNNCHASHIKAWRRIVELGKPCLILEHDTFVKGDVRNIAMPDDAIITFGHRIGHPDWYNPPTPIKELVKIQTQSGAHAYAVTPKTAQWLIDDVEKNGVNINVDEWVNLKCGLPLYVVDPPQAVCWPRMSTREWVKEEEKRLSPGATWSFASSNTPGWNAGFKALL